MRSVTAASRSSAAFAIRISVARSGSVGSSTVDCTVNDSRGASGGEAFASGSVRRIAALRSEALRARVAVVGIDDLLHERMADDVGAREAHERDAAHVAQHALGLDQAALLAAREVDLRDVAGDH